MDSTDHHCWGLTVKIIDYKIVRNHHIAREYLGIEDEDVIQVKRVQLGDGCPIVYENIFLPVKYFDKIEKEEFINSLQQVVDQHFLKKDTQPPPLTVNSLNFS